MRPRRLSALAGQVVFALAVAVACDSPVDPAVGLVRTTADHYVLRPDGVGWSVDIGLSVENRSDRTVALLTCPGSTPLDVEPLWTLERRRGAEWRTVLTPRLSRCATPDIPVRPGATVSATVRLHHDPTQPPAFSDWPVDGEFRLILYPHWFHRSSHVALPLESRTSNTFTLEVADP